MAIYDGEALSSLRHTDSYWQGYCPGREYGDGVAIAAVAGRRYAVRVDSISGGDFELLIAPAGSASVRAVRVGGERRVQVVYAAAPEEPDEVGIALDWDPRADSIFTDRPLPPFPPLSFAVYNGIAAAPGPGCSVAGRQRYINCPIPDGRRPAGPLVMLGEQDDAASVEYSRLGTTILGGEGDDIIHASGRIRGGPGDDLIQARTWGRSQISGGPGDDLIDGSRRGDQIAPGPGIDHVSAGRGRDVVRSRDGEIDYIGCGGTAFIDALDLADCERVHRRGAARAVPDEDPFRTDLDIRHQQLWIACPADGPLTCAGSVTVSRGSEVFLRLRFKIRRSDHPDFDHSDYVEFRASPRLYRRMVGKVRITVTSRDRAGKLRAASGRYHFPHPPD